MVSSVTGNNKRSYIATIIVETGAATKTVSVAVAEGQEETGSVVMSYKANSSAPEWTEATEPVEIAGEGAEVFQFVATPADGYKFAGWTTTGDIRLTDSTASTTEGNSAKETSVVTANFERDATLTSLAISGTATKLNYFVGDTFNPAGLVVTATYSDGAKDEVTDQVNWAFNPESFAEAGTVSVEVTANIDAIYSEAFTVNDIVVVDVDKYALVTDATLLADGQHIIIANADATYALSTNQKSTNRGAVAITANDGIIVPSEGVQIITLDSIMVEDAIKWELRVAADSFLYAASTGENHLKTRKGNSGDTQGQWTISIDAKGVATVKASGTARNWMRYNPNNNSPLFSCYEKGQNDIAIYARQYTVKVVSNDENMGTVSGDGKYFENNVAELVATPKAGYKLTGWSNNNELTKNEQSLVVTENITITAYFAKGETAIDNAAVETPAVKTIENGQLVILRDGVKYNAMGVRLQ
ncbi:MAG: InlB B-repeat-containing protein [Paludibacteraceae bacterium]|nr:InlB B-repeat-containing protein [Paludibacteraceae bacterium]